MSKITNLLGDQAAFYFRSVDGKHDTIYWFRSIRISSMFGPGKDGIYMDYPKTYPTYVSGNS